MVTGAGGSIGSELCRQIARVAPRRLDPASTTPRTTSSASSASSRTTATSTRRRSPPCSPTARRASGCARSSPSTARRSSSTPPPTSTSGSWSATRSRRCATTRSPRGWWRGWRARRASSASCSSRPTRRCSPATVMGASKALAEFAVEAAQQRWPETKFATVRFGNVLGSSGSVVPIFRRQIALGGPVTVTDERMTRYFMTIPEAVQLVIRAGSLGRGRRGLRARDGRAGLDHAARARHDRALRARARDATSRSRSSAAGRARSCTRSCSTPTSARSRRRPRRSCCAEREPLDPGGRGGDVRRDRAARARGRRGRPRGQGRASSRPRRPAAHEPGEAPAVRTVP